SLVIFALGTIAISFAVFSGQIISEARWLTPAQFEQTLSAIPGSLSVYQWLPIWVHEPLPKMSAQVEAGDRAVKIESWTGQSRVFHVAAGDASEARIETFFYPHWRASAGDRRLAVHPDQNGALLVALPKEPAEINLEF